MKETVLDVLMYLFDNYLSADFDWSEDDDVIADELEQAGFEEQDISTAIHWLSHLEDLYKDIGHQTESEQSVRMLTHQERVKLDTNCQGYLIELLGQGVLDPATREIILETAMAIDVQTLNMSQFKRLIALVLLHHPNAEVVITTDEDLYQDAEVIVH